MKKIKPITEGRVKSQVKVYDGDAPKTQAPPPPKPPMRCGEWQVNNKRKQIVFPSEENKRTPTYPKLNKTYNIYLSSELFNKKEIFENINIDYNINYDNYNINDFNKYYNIWFL